MVSYSSLHPCILLLFVASMMLPTVMAKKKQPPVWPEQFHAVLLQNRNGSYADVDLFYDWPGGRNLNIIDDHVNVLWDNERSNGSTFYYHPATVDCQVVDMRVGILTPDWLKGADYLGVDTANDHKVDVWAKNSTFHHPFLTYYADIETGDPVRWIFFDQGEFTVLKWIPEDGTGKGLLDDSQWQIPSYCF